MIICSCLLKKSQNRNHNQYWICRFFFSDFIRPHTPRESETLNPIQSFVYNLEKLLSFFLLSKKFHCYDEICKTQRILQGVRGLPQPHFLEVLISITYIIYLLLEVPLISCYVTPTLDIFFEKKKGSGGLQAQFLDSSDFFRKNG